MHKTTPLYPPGDPILITMSDPKTKEIQLRKIRSIQYFGKFINNLNEMHHMMTLYREWIEQYVKLYIQAHPESANVFK